MKVLVLFLLVVSPASFGMSVESVKELAEKGNYYGQYFLAQMYYLGEGVLQDHDKAIDWMRKAAEHKYKSDAKYELGWLYAQEKRDYREALTWYRRAAESRIADSRYQYSLGLMYYEGDLGVLQNYVKAHQWLNIATKRGYEPARKLLRILTSILTPKQIIEAQRLAQCWFPSIRRESRITGSLDCLHID